MKLPVFFRFEAEQDLSQAFKWYENQSSGLGAQFMSAIEMKLEQIQAAPAQFPPVRHLIRRAILRRFPYSIFFLVQMESIHVIAVLHHARHSSHWHRRT